MGPKPYTSPLKRLPLTLSFGPQTLNPNPREETEEKDKRFRQAQSMMQRGRSDEGCVLVSSGPCSLAGVKVIGFYILTRAFCGFQG